MALFQDRLFGTFGPLGYPTPARGRAGYRAAQNLAAIQEWSAEGAANARPRPRRERPVDLGKNGAVVCLRAGSRWGNLGVGGFWKPQEDLYQHHEGGFLEGMVVIVF